MRKFSFFFLAGIILQFASLAQVAVTNPANTTPALAATYTTLQNAISDLNNITAISGPVVITLNAGNPQTAPAGGYEIRFLANTTAANNITIAGNNNTITAFTPQPVGSLTDAVFKLIGVDHVVLQDFMMMENAANVNSTPGTNDMTEFGVALLRANNADGAQNNTILNNTIALNKTYTNTFGLYSSVRHSSTGITADDITSFNGSNSGNRIYGNSISNVNYAVVFMGSVTPAFMDNGNDIGGSSAATGNICSNWGTAAAGSSYPDLTGSNFGIFMVHGINENISYNVISSDVHAGINALGGILKNFTTAQPTGVISATYNNNTINLSKSSSAGAVTGISIEGMFPALSTAAISINNNLVSSIAVSGAGSTSAITGISNSSACGVLNINNNTVRGCTSTGTAPGGLFTGITNSGAVVHTININGNKLGDAIAGAISYSLFTTASLFGIHNTQHPVTCSVSISNNDFRGIVYSMGSSSFQYYIANIATGQQVGNLVIDGNTFTNLSVNTSSSITFISREGHMTASSSIQCSNNSIVGGFTNSYAGATPGNLFFYYVQQVPSQSVNGSVVTVTGNNFSNVTVNGAISIIGYYDLEGVSNVNAPAKTYTGNVMNNITMGTGTIYAMYITNSGRVVCSTNVVSNITTGGFIAGIWHGSTNGQGPDHVSNNTVTNLASGNANVVGIMAGSSAVPIVNISGNVVSGLSSTGTTNIQLVGIEIIGGQTVNVSNNTVDDIQGSGAGATSFAYGIRVNTGSSVQVFQNKIYNVRHVGVTTAPASSVIGLQILNPANLTAYNNFIADLKAPNSAQADAIRGINVNALGANTTYRLYYNSIYINAVSSGANFGSSGIFHTANATATTGRLEMINNIIVNTSTPNGTGITAAFRRSNTTLNNLVATSDHNLFYAGTPSASRLIYYDAVNSDQALATYQARVTPRDANSISLMPSFVSATDLHLTASNCPLDGKGIPITGYTTDIDNDIRDAIASDIGADEFTAVNLTTLAGVVATAVCDFKMVSPGGTTYVSNACDLIARVTPSGGDPVGGMINVCVTLDPTQQYFNGEPYVQRHYDIEPVVSNQTTTSATVTLYFYDAEFVQYNTNNPAWPKLPTIAGGGNGDPFIANVKVTQFHGTPTGGLPTTTPGNYTGNRVLLVPVSVVLNGTVWEVTVNIAGFSGFYVHSNTWGGPLPVSINYFTGLRQNNNHVLNWKVTCNHTAGVTMQLERSADSRNFTAINSISADASRCDQPFYHTDSHPLAGMNYYRLKITDDAGKLSYSSIVALLNAAKGFEIVSIAPNPVSGNTFKLNIASTTASVMQVMISDMQGRVVKRQSVALTPGFNAVPVAVVGLAAGTYTIAASLAGEQALPMRFVKQ